MPEPSTFGPRTPLPKGPNQLSPSEIADSHRTRLMTAITKLVAAHGWTEVSIANVVAEAGVSRSAFYENFTDKEDCLLRAFDIYSQGVAEAVAQSVDPDLGWVELTTVVITAFIDKLQSDIPASKAFYVEMEAAGPEARARRRVGAGAFTELLKYQHTIALAEDPQLKPVPDRIFAGVVLGIRELVREELDRSGDPDLTVLTDDIVAWIVAVTRGFD
ncbi:MAG: TetR/AcrR family transcriptional regulator [Solirubrobacterales bacterium]